MSTHDPEITEAYASLTKHPEGSVREMWTLAVPLMLSFISGNLMMFLDRLILANYSTAAMNAAVTTGMANAVFQYGAIGVAAIAEVFVGQHNGAKRLAKVGEPVWQMLWFSLLTALVFWPLGLFAAEWFSPGEHYGDLATDYFRWMMFFGPIMPAFTALSSFYIGLGKVRLVTVTTIVSNILNVLLDIAMVFGVEGWLPAMGTKGAAIATGLAQSIGLLVLLLVFLRPAYRARYGTGKLAFKLKSFMQCLRIGGPNAIGHMIEIFAWATLLRMVASISEQHLTVYAVGQGFLILVAFANQGLEKAVTTVCANLIGARKWELIPHAMRSGAAVLACIAAFAALFLLGFPDPVIDAFLSNETLPADTELLVNMVKETCFWVLLFIIFDGLIWVFAAVLTAAGDTKFVMLMSGLGAWLFAIVPFYFFVVVPEASPVRGWAITAGYACATSFCFYLRYRSGRWQRLVIAD